LSEIYAFSVKSSDFESESDNDNHSSDCMIISGLSVPANCLDDPMVTSETAFSSIDLMGCNSKFTTVESILNFCLPFDAKL
jgi:hypothetical protein